MPECDFAEGLVLSSAPTSENKLEIASARHNERSPASVFRQSNASTIGIRSTTNLAGCLTLGLVRV